MGPDVGHELEGHLGQGDLGDVQLVLGDQAQQQLERALEDVEVYLEGLALCSAQYATRRQTGAGHRRRHIVRVNRPGQGLSGPGGRIGFGRPQENAGSDLCNLNGRGPGHGAQAAPPRAMSSRAICR